MIQNRKTNPGVKNGRVQKKHNHKVTPSVRNTRGAYPLVAKEKPGEGYKHFLTKKDIIEFIELLPDWEILSEGLKTIILSRAYYNADAICTNTGIIEICSWPREKWIKCSKSYYDDHKDLFSKLNVECVPQSKLYLCKFEINQIKAYQLLHLLLHELGHHHDRMTTKKQKQSSRGEHFAEEYARKYEEQIWHDYLRKFSLY
jgi:hypothetical protein